MKIENRKIRFSIFLIVALKPFLYLFRFIAMNKLEDIIRYEQFDNLEFIASQIVAGFITGLHRSPYHGFSVEFAEHRVYNTGESTKHVNWKLYARTEKLFVKQFEEETNLRSYLVLDTSSSMLFPYPSAKVSKLRFSVYCAAALIHLLRKQRDASGLCLFSDRIEVLTDAKSNSTHIQTMYAHLQEILPKSFGFPEQTHIDSPGAPPTGGYHTKKSAGRYFHRYVFERRYGRTLFSSPTPLL